MSTIAIDYDKKYDILYARLPFSDHSYGSENNGIVTFHSIETDEVTGMAVYSFKERLEKGSINLNELPVPIDLTN